MNLFRRLPFAVACWVITLLAHIATPMPQARGDESDARQREFFEARIRPALVRYCYECHNSRGVAEGDLVLDHRSGWQQGGSGGAVIVPGDPAGSRLLLTLRHQIDGLEMPQGGERLPVATIADFEQWIGSGAFDPRDQPPTDEELVAATSWESILQKRKQWWSFRPIVATAPPEGDGLPWNDHPVDRFIISKMHQAGLQPSPLSDAEPLVRRLFFALTGLPPTPEQAQHWSKELREAAEPRRTLVWRQLVRELLDSPQFGHRWARHWMDWIRYAESHGSEGDPEIVGAWHYRDYLIRALNGDVPYDQLLQEHLAGDLLPHPRRDPHTGNNESLLATAHWRMVFHGFAPTDALDEKVRFVDQQIDTFSKTFLGLTVSCARCHDHKFDAISQQDYYALFGIFGSCRPGRAVLESPAAIGIHSDELTQWKSALRTALCEQWTESLAALRVELVSRAASSDTAASDAVPLLRPLLEIRDAIASGESFATAWRPQQSRSAAAIENWQAFQDRPAVGRWDFAASDSPLPIYRDGPSVATPVARSGELVIDPAGDRVLLGIYPQGTYSHRLSTKHPGRLTTADQQLGDDLEWWVQVRGDGSAGLRYVVQDYPRSGTVYPQRRPKDVWQWERFDLSYWSGDDVHLELVTALDAPLLVQQQPRSWFGVRQAVLQPRGSGAPPRFDEAWQEVFAITQASPPQDIRDLVDAYVEAIARAIAAWSQDRASDGQALLLDACLQAGLLANHRGSSATVDQWLEKYRRLEAEIPIGTRVPTLVETAAADQPLMVRGDHRQLADLVPRRFLEAIDSQPYATTKSGRWELAQDCLRPDNPLVRRVIVNRLWHHLFGQGIVRTPNNFGWLGDRPTHPELLDWLATELPRRDWSLKQMIELLVTSRTWQLSSLPTAAATEIDPDNRYWSHARVRRLEAEAIRDQLLSLSGRLDLTPFGPSVAGDVPRRSIYVRVRRNALEPFLRAFDFPEPASTVGRRDVTNVPAQSLTMLNEPQVQQWAAEWADQVVRDETLTDDSAKIKAMFWSALGRDATPNELRQTEAYLKQVRQRNLADQQQRRQLDDSLARSQQQHDRLFQQVRNRLAEAESAAGSESASDSLRQRTASRKSPEPTWMWDFGTGAANATPIAGDSPPLQLHGGAEVRDQALQLHSGGYAVSTPLDRPLQAKTLEAWVQLDRLDQRGGGVLSVQSPDGGVFDAIVFGERDPQQWLAGSDHFHRTQAFAGPSETEANQRPVHVAVVYHADGRVVGYRDGLPYGRPYQSNGPHTFSEGKFVVGLGVRHLPAAGNRLLIGAIRRARIYDRALTDAEVQSSFAAAEGRITDQQVRESMTAAEQELIQRGTEQRRSWRAQRETLGPAVDVTDPAVPYVDLAQAFFTLQELIFLR